jgi:hypothetical protein
MTWVFLAFVFRLSLSFILSLVTHSYEDYLHRRSTLMLHMGTGRRYICSDSAGVYAELRSGRLNEFDHIHGPNHVLLLWRSLERVGKKSLA